jgi:cytochrome b561
MISPEGWTVIAIVLILVVLFNLGLAVSFLRGRGKDQSLLFRDTIQRTLNPWQEEDEAIAKLHEQVKSLGLEEEDSDKED